MTPLARLVAVALGVAGLLAAAAAFVREAVLAAEPTASWPVADWWVNLADQPAWQTGVAAAGCAVLAAALALLAYRQVRPARRGAGAVELVGERGKARLDIRALERALLRRLQADLRWTTLRRVSLRESGDRWRARLEGDVVLRDLAGLQRRAAQIVAADLLRMGGLQLEAVDIVAGGALPPTHQSAQKEDLGMTRSS
jgi:hypothetical protein